MSNPGIFVQFPDGVQCRTSTVLQYSNYSLLWEVIRAGRTGVISFFEHVAMPPCMVLDSSGFDHIERSRVELRYMTVMAGYHESDTNVTWGT